MEMGALGKPQGWREWVSGVLGSDHGILTVSGLTSLLEGSRSGPFVDSGLEGTRT